jgi:hypothetical protein
VTERRMVTERLRKGKAIDPVRNDRGGMTSGKERTSNQSVRT